jgi:hypothetical protein
MPVEVLRDDGISSVSMMKISKNVSPRLYRFQIVLFLTGAMPRTADIYTVGRLNFIFILGKCKIDLESRYSEGVSSPQ